MSFSNQKRKWVIREPARPYSSPEERDACVNRVSSEFNIPMICAELICDRGFRTAEEVHSFIYKNYISGRNPFLLADMQRAVDRINRAVSNPDEVVAIFGDYDVDGVTSVSVLYLYLTGKGVKTGYYIPKRSDGYGMTRESIDKLAAHGVTLIITVDTGITALEEIAYAASLGIDTVVTDHHECRSELPQACAVVNPHRPDCGYPFKELAGVGVVYKLLTALEIAEARAAGKNEYEAERGVLLKYADLIAIGTVADVMPIVDENRMVVSFGLSMLSKSRRKGINALVEASAKHIDGPVTSSFISFTIAPRLNAAGRMDNASLAVELLLSDNDGNARRLAQKLCEINLQRQVEENRIASEAIAKLEADASYMDDRFLILDSDDWMHGVIGIVASRITEKYAKPAILITFEGAVTPGIQLPVDEGKGSGRSIRGINLFSALSSCEDFLIRYGGHELAAGLSVRRKDIPELRRRLNAYVAEHLSTADFLQTYDADMEVTPDRITLELADDITRILEPCSTGNPLPVFIMRDVTVLSVHGIASGKHTKLTVKKDGYRFQAIYYGVSASELPFDSGDCADLLFSITSNTYNGETTVQLLLNDICYSRRFFQNRLSDREKVRAILRGERVVNIGSDLPERDDFVALYGVLNDILKNGRDTFSDNYLLRRLREEHLDTRISYVKLKIMLAVFAEMDIFKIRQDSCIADEDSSEWCIPQDYISISPVFHPRKVDLDSSAILTRLRNI